jgi:hypothetical protein
MNPAASWRHFYQRVLKIATLSLSLVSSAIVSVRAGAHRAKRRDLELRRIFANANYTTTSNIMRFRRGQGADRSATCRRIAKLTLN